MKKNYLIKHYEEDELKDFPIDLLYEELKLTHEKILHYDKSMLLSYMSIATLIVSLSISLQKNIDINILGIGIFLFILLIIFILVAKFVNAAHQEYKDLLVKEIKKKHKKGQQWKKH